MVTDDDLYDMDDAELNAAFKAAKAELASPEVGQEMDNGSVDNSADTEEFDETTEDTSDTSEFDEEDNESDVEQPEEDSDHDASKEEGDETDSEENTDETDEGELDGEPTEDESDATEEDDKATDNLQPVQKQKFKAHGRDYEFTTEEVMTQFPKIFGQAMDYTKKMQTIKPWRKTIDAIESAQLGHEDVSLMIDVLKGDKDAISEVIRRTGVDALDLDTENSKYVTKDYGRDEKALDIKDVIEGISKDKEYSTTQDILSTQWDDNSWNTMSEDPQMIKLLHDDVKSGMYDTLQPIVDKLKIFDGGKKSDLDYYGMAAQEYYKGISQEQEQKASTEAATALAKQELEQKAETQRLEKVASVKAQDDARKATQSASKKRKAAAPTKSTAGKREVTDYLDDSDESYDEWYAAIQAKQ